MKRVLPLLLVLALGAPAALSASGCSLYQAYVQRQAIQQAQFSFKSAALMGVDLSGANLQITLELANPTEVPIVLDRLDYTLFINDQRAVAGFTTQQVRVPAQDVRPVTFTTHVRYADVGNQLRGILSRGVASYRLAGVGHFDTPVGTIDYPIELFNNQTR